MAGGRSGEKKRSLSKRVMTEREEWGRREEAE